MLILTRKTEQQIKIGEDITLTIIEVKGDQVKIGVEAPKTVKVYRKEVFDSIQDENKAALTQGNSTMFFSSTSTISLDFVQTFIFHLKVHFYKEKS